MNRHIASVVKQVVSEYVNRIEVGGNRKKLVIVLDYESLSQDAVWEAVQSVRNNYETTIFASETWYPQASTGSEKPSVQKLPGNRKALIEELQSADALVVPSISFSYIAKLSMTMDDDLPLHASILMQLQGKPVIACSDNLGVDESASRTVRDGVSRRIQSYFRQLKNENVLVVKLSELPASIKRRMDIPAKRRLISAEDIRALSAKGQRELVMPKRSIVTPMGKDAIRHYGMTVTYMDGQEEG